MTNQNSISEIIRIFIKLRGKTMKEASSNLGIKIKTLYDEIQHNRISAELLFKLSTYLEIDLEWMKTALGNTHQFSRLQPKRMSCEFREIVKPHVLTVLNTLTDELKNPKQITDKLIAEYKSLYYVLDVLIDESAGVAVEKDRCLVTNYGKNFNDISRFMSHNGRNVLIEYIENHLESKDVTYEIFMEDQKCIEFELEIQDICDEDEITSLGMAYHNNGNYKYAFVCFSRAQEISDDPMIHALKGNTLSACGLEDEAIAEYEQCLNCENEIVAGELFELYKSTKRYDKALEIIKIIEADIDLYWFTPDELKAEQIFIYMQLKDNESLYKCCNGIIKSSTDPDFIKYAKKIKESIKNERI